LGLILYKNGLTCLIILSNGFLLGEDLYSGVLENNNLMVKHTGWAVPLLNINLFTTINNIELVPYYGAKIAKAAGSSGILIGKFLDKALVKLGSG
jgi:large subunit ribosomal protein L2